MDDNLKVIPGTDVPLPETEDPVEAGIVVPLTPEDNEQAKDE